MDHSLAAYLAVLAGECCSSQLAVDSREDWEQARENELFSLGASQSFAAIKPK